MLLGVTLGFQTIQGRHIVASDLAQNDIQCMSSELNSSVYRGLFQRVFQTPCPAVLVRERVSKYKGWTKIWKHPTKDTLP
jgi:hypothetical protein